MELSSCPFCGKSKAVLRPIDDDVFYVQCSLVAGGCGVQTRNFVTSVEAVNAWNRRPPVAEPPTEHDAVNHPKHYTSHPSGVECVTIAEHFGFNLGNAIKYIWRAGLKLDLIEDLKKAVWYINRELSNREKSK